MSTFRFVTEEITSYTFEVTAASQEEAEQRFATEGHEISSKTTGSRVVDVLLLVDGKWIPTATFES
jgi:hypothetical protein